MILINVYYLKNDENLCQSLISSRDKDVTSLQQEKSVSLVSETLPFPQEGISITAVNKFIELCGGKSLLQGMTTTEVNNEALMPLTFAYKTSYCGLLDRQKAEQHEIYNKNLTMDMISTCEEKESKENKPCAFISHAWKYQFLDVMDAIKDHFNCDNEMTDLSLPSDSVDESQVIIWLDLFTNNQHLAPDLDFHWWSTTFKTAIQNIGRTVMVLSPWENPVPFTRAWCLFEIFCTVDTNTIFEVAMCKAQKEALVRAASDDLRNFRNMITIIDVENSEAWNPADLEKIFHVVKNTVGFPVINSTVLSEVRKWLIDTLKKEVKMATEEYSKLKLMNTLGLLHYENGNYDLAFDILKECLDRLNEIEGKESHPSIQRMNNLAIMLDKQGRSNAAAPMFQNCLDMYARTVGTMEPDYYNTLNSLAVCRRNMGEYEESSEHFRKCVGFFRESLGEFHTTTLNTMGNAGVSLDIQGDTEEALVCFEEVVRKCRNAFGPTHLDTLRWSNSLGIVYNKLGRHEEAMDLLESTYSVKKVKFGINHDSTVLTLNNFCQLILDTMSWHRLEALQNILEDYKRIKGIHRTAWALMYSISLIYLKTLKYEDCAVMCEELIQQSNQVLDKDDPFLDIYRKHRDMCIEVEKEEKYMETLPIKLQNADFHEHTLDRVNCPYGKVGFCCDVCNVASQGWVYHCATCGYDAHIQCVPGELLVNIDN